MTLRRVSAGLPDFPWDTIADARVRAQAHPDGIVDLSVGTPIDPVDPLIREALAEASGVPGYPATAGTAELREAAVAALSRRHGVTGLAPAAVLPVIGTKELISSLPATLGVPAGATVVIPEIAYPTYEVGALLAGARPLRADATIAVGPERPALFFLNSPANPTGRVLGVEHLRKVVQWARDRGTVVVADECYIDLGWDEKPLSILDPAVCDGDHRRLLAVHSLSKSSNLASYRAGFVAGDRELIDELLAVRKHAGLMMPYPVQQAMTAALADDAHVATQRERYRARRAVLLSAVIRAGLRVEHSEAGLYLWVTRDENCRTTLDWLAGLGILGAPGDFYGPRGTEHVRLSLTATDEQVAAAARRLAG